MIQKTLTIVATIILCLWAPNQGVFAQEKASEAPLAAMRALAPMAGDWLLTSRYTADDGKTWQDVGATRASVTTRQKGLLLSEIPLDTDKPGFHMESHITYDQYRKVYRKAAIDDNWGLMDVYEGTLEGNRLVLTNLRSGTFFPVGSDTWRAFRITIELAAQKRLMTVEKSDDSGASWQPNFEIVYTWLENN